MPASHRRTWQQYRVGRLNITVQLDSTTEARSIERHQELAVVARQLISTMDAARVPATWAVSDPAHSAATALIISSAVEHELAILGDANWVGPTAGRTRFARELIRRVTQARAAGIEVTTLVPGVASIEGHIDLIVKQQITAVVGMSGPAAVKPATKPRALHYGVWEVPQSSSLPLKATWLSSGRRALWRQIQRTSADAGAFHLLVDAAAMAAAKRSDEANVKWLIQRVATLRDRGLIRVETLRTTAARLSDIPAPAPQRSILRVA